MKITQKDLLIYEYITTHHFATVKQIANVFYNDIIYRNELAKKRLMCLVEHKLIKTNKSTNSAQHIFYENSIYKRQTYHNIVVMDFISKLREMPSVEVMHFEREKSWHTNDNTSIRSDAYVVIYCNGFLRSFIVEARTSNNSWKNSIGKYNKYKDEILSVSSGTIPVLVSIDKAKHSLDDIESFMPIIQLDDKLNDFPLIFDL